MTPATTYTPLPVRRRDLLEVFDTGLKLYRRYFWILLGWSFIANLASSLCQCIFVFSAPLIVGACSCCIAAAVRGQNVTFSQCWRFLKPRYWASVGQFLLVFILSWIGIFGLWVAVLMAVVWGSMAMAAMSLPSSVTMILTVILVLLAVVLCTVVLSVILAWTCMTPIIVCLEDDKRGGAAQTRAWDLLRREWVRATGLYSLLGLASTAIFGIVGGFLLLLIGLKNVEQMMEGTGSVNETVFVLAFSALGNLVGTFTLPLLLLVSGVFYLDLRVRKEALDIEWSAHVTAPAAVEAPAAPNAALQQAPNAAGALGPSSLGTGPAPAPPPPVVDRTWEMENFGPPPTPAGSPAPPAPEVGPAPTQAESVPFSPSSPSPAPAAEPVVFAPSPAAPESSGFGAPPVHSPPPAEPAGFSPPPAPTTPGLGNPPAYVPPRVETSSFAPPIDNPSSFGASSFNPPAERSSFAPAPEPSGFGSSGSSFGDPSSFGAPTGFGSLPDTDPSGFAPSPEPAAPPEPPVVERKPSDESVDPPRTD